MYSSVLRTQAPVLTLCVPVMKVLVLNCGSSSVKCQLIETSPEQAAASTDRRLARISIDRIGAGESQVRCEAPGPDAFEYRRQVGGHHEAVRIAVETLLDRLGKLVHSKEEIEGVGHRIVHGGERFTHSVLMDEEVVRHIEAASELAPLHNPANLKGYHAARAVLPRARHAAVFDTAFHQTIPPRAYLYGLPYSAYERHRIRRYGFHGTSHRYVTERFAQLRGSVSENFKLITCHLGNGSSMAAVDRGKSVDSSMGFTPLEGLMMGTRSGDVDPAAVLWLMDRENLSTADAARILNQQSGLLGISGVASDMRTLLERSRNGEERSQLAIDVFCYRVRRYLGALFAVLDGCDAVIFTGGIGENCAEIRARVCGSLGSLGIRLDPERNAEAEGAEMRISAAEASTEVWVIPTNEELLIARDTMRCILDVPGR